jgi:hypothetical protein
MKKEKSKITWQDVKNILIKKGNRELLKLIGDLYSLNNKNKTFVHAKYSLIDPLKPYKEIILKSLYPDPMNNEQLSLGTGRKAISEYKKAVGDAIGVLELSIYYIESGHRFTLEYGDIDEQFYDSLESMFAKVLKILTQFDQTVIDKYFPRLLSLTEEVSGIGWGYYDNLMSELEEAFPEKF